MSVSVSNKIVHGWLSAPLLHALQKELLQNGGGY